MGRTANKITVETDIVDTDTIEAGYDTTITTEGNRIELTILYNFDIIGDTSKIDFISLIPADYEDRQKIFNINYSMLPEHIFYNGSNKYAEFIILNPSSDFELEIKADLEIYDYDLDRALSLNKSKPMTEDLLKYLEEEKYIEVNDQLIQNIDSIHIATEIPLDHVEILYEYVMENLDYIEYNPEDLGAVETLKNKGGDCTDYTDVFVTLCRAAGFPARSVEGYPIDTGDLAMGHNWPEVFISGYGWIPFDPTYDDNNGSSESSTFKNLKNVYIYISFIRNDITLNNYHYYYYTFLGDDLDINKKIYINDK
jgi:transglutaminase-like putative cysteine protease